MPFPTTTRIDTSSRAFLPAFCRAAQLGEHALRRIRIGFHERVDEPDRNREGHEMLPADGGGSTTCLIDPVLVACTSPLTPADVGV